MKPEEEKALEHLVGTSQSKVVCSYVRDLKEKIKAELFTIEETTIEELKGRKIALEYLDRIILKLSNEKTDKQPDNYL
jgi:hypothetical protein